MAVTQFKLFPYVALLKPTVRTCAISSGVFALQHLFKSADYVDCYYRAARCDAARSDPSFNRSIASNCPQTDYKA